MQVLASASALGPGARIGGPGEPPLGLDLTAMEVEGVPVAGWLGSLRDKLRELKSALEANDHVLVSGHPPLRVRPR